MYFKKSSFLKELIDLAGATGDVTFVGFEAGGALVGAGADVAVVDGAVLTVGAGSCVACWLVFSMTASVIFALSVMAKF